MTATVLSTERPFMLLPRLVGAVRRRWRLGAAIGVLGLLVAVALSLAFPPVFRATTTVLVRHPDFGVIDPAQAIATDAQLVTSRPTAERAVRQLGSGVSASELLGSAEAFAQTNSVLRITVSATNADDAIRRSGALAEAFLAYRAELRLLQAEAEIRVLAERQEELRRELESLNAQLGPGGTPVESAQGRGELLARRSDLANKVAELGRRAEESTLTARTIASASRIVDPARLDDRSPVRALLANMATGLVAGVALGLAVIALQEIASDRVHRRDDLAAALVAPVTVSVGPLRGSPAIQRRRLRERAGEAEADVARAVRHFRDVLATKDETTPALVVVSVASDGVTALLVGALALELARDDYEVLLADLSGHASVAGLLEVSPSPDRSAVSVPGTGGRLAVTVSTADVLSQWDSFDGPPRGRARVVLAMATLDPAIGASHLSAVGSTAVAVVTAGRSSATALSATTQMLRAAGIELHSAVLVGASRQDESVGVIDAPLADLPGRPSASWVAR